MNASLRLRILKNLKKMPLDLNLEKIYSIITNKPFYHLISNVMSIVNHTKQRAYFIFHSNDTKASSVSDSDYIGSECQRTLLTSLIMLQNLITPFPERN